MAHYDEKSGEIILTNEDRENMRIGSLKGFASRIINNIIWGNPKGELTIKENDRPENIK